MTRNTTGQIFPTGGSGYVGAVAPPASPTHSVWGTGAPAGTFSQHTDGTPSIELGNCFYRHGTPPGWWAGSRIVGGRFYLGAGITVPAGSGTMRIYTNPAGIGEPITSFGTLAGTKTFTGSTFVTGWNTLLLDTPTPMPANGGLVVVTMQFATAGWYTANTGARPSSDFVDAADGTKLVWSETSSPYFGAIYRIGSTYGRAVATTSYCTDLLMDEG